MNKAKRNYYVDVVIGIAFLVTALSALVFLVPLNWIDFSTSTTPTVLGVDFGVWQLLHKWGGIAMLVGVVVHLLLHWKWIVCVVQGRPREGSGPRAMLGLMGLVAAIALVADGVVVGSAIVQHAAEGGPVAPTLDFVRSLADGVRKGSESRG